MTIVTQDNLSLNYRFIKSIGIYDAELVENGEHCVIISAHYESSKDDIDIAAYSSEIEAETAYASFQNALRNNAGIFVFPNESSLTKNDVVEQPNSNNPGYKNRFVNKDED